LEGHGRREECEAFRLRGMSHYASHVPAPHRPGLYGATTRVRAERRKGNTRRRVLPSVFPS